MSDHMSIWNKHADIDPSMTKGITGKDYGGTSPNAHHVIWCLTDLFGPVGQGFGWRVVADAIEHFGDTAIHWCRIEFWHTDRANTFEAYGQTKMAYMTKGGSGYLKVDEDAPKKSLTDAITKAAAQIGVASNIFLGRWDDNKYVQGVVDDFAKRNAPPPDHAGTRDRIKAAIERAETLAALDKLWKHPMTCEAFVSLPDDMKAELVEAHTRRSNMLANMDANFDLGGDEIPDFGKDKE